MMVSFSSFLYLTDETTNLFSRSEQIWEIDLWLNIQNIDIRGSTSCNVCICQISKKKSNLNVIIFKIDWLPMSKYDTRFLHITEQKTNFVSRFYILQKLQNNSRFIWSNAYLDIWIISSKMKFLHVTTDVKSWKYQHFFLYYIILVNLSTCCIL